MADVQSKPLVSSNAAIIVDTPERKSKWWRWFLIVGLACLGLILLIWIIHSRQPADTKTTSTPANYRQRLCDDAYQHDVQEPPGDHFTVTFHEGCFGGKVRIPSGWNGWDYQPVGNDPSWWVAFWPEGSQNPRGPVDRNTHLDFMYLPMRFQGKEGEKILIYTMGGGPASQEAPSASSADHPPFTATGYKKEFCELASDDTLRLVDFSNQNNLLFDAQLVPGCFYGPIKIPNNWRKYRVHKSQDKDDWAAVWCDGNADPSKVHPYFEDFDENDFLGNGSRGCSIFYLQGQGKITFTRTELQ